MLCRALLSILATAGCCVLARGQTHVAHPVVASFERFAADGTLPSADAGELLLSELACRACHADDSATLKQAPALHAAGLRLHPDWMAAFIASPHSIKPGTTMPDMLWHLTDQQRSEVSQALAAFLHSQRQPYKPLKATGTNPVPHQFWNHGNADRGRELYHQSGCVACHAADQDYETSEAAASPIDQLLEQLDPEELIEMGLGDALQTAPSVPHAVLSEKYTAIGLAHFLLDPLSVRPSGRMPNMKLSVVEAADLAAYLLERDGAPEPASQPIDAALIASGKKWFVDLACVNCHAAVDVSSAERSLASALTTMADSPSAICRSSTAENSTADSSPANGVPRYALSSLQDSAIIAALARSTPPASTPQRLVHMEMLRQNCYACHSRDTIGGVGRNRRAYFVTDGHIDLGDEGRLPPPLTGVGRKLTQPWMTKVLKGQNADLRGYMMARMPVFAADVAAHLPAHFAAADQPDGKDPAAVVDEAEVFGDTAGLAAAGLRLMDIGCVQCHAFRGESLPGVRGIDLAGVADRLQPSWFRQFLLNPGNVKERTRMPTFFQNGESQDKQLLGGDPERQIAAMWTYLKQLDQQPLPDKIRAARATDFELVPEDRPILLRTFMQAAGTHAIAVGFPAKVHFAYDALECRPALLWRDRFLDAEGTWFIRFTPPADPLGSEQRKLPVGYPLVALTADADEPGDAAKNRDGDFSPRFAGYQLDDSGTPTFSSRWRGWQLSDRLEPDAMGFKRTLTVTRLAPEAASSAVAIRIHAAERLSPVSPRVMHDQAGMRTELLSSNLQTQVRQRSGQQEWLIPVFATDGADEENAQTIEVHYAW